jgi:hypothetical protein
LQVRLLLVLLALVASVCNAQIVQEDFAEDEAFVYKAELTAGIMLNTVGGIPGGFRVKYAWQRQKKPKQFNNISFDIVNIKHPKEYRLPTDSGSGYYIYQKINYLFVLRPNFSREFLLFRKSSEDGIELKLVVSAGPSFGLVKPYYVTVSYGRGGTATVPYSPSLNQGQILGSSFFSGFDQMQLVMGANTRVSMEFGISAFDTFVTGVELGFQVEQFSQKIYMIAEEPGRSNYTSAFVNIYFGKRY